MSLMMSSRLSLLRDKNMYSITESLRYYLYISTRYHNNPFSEAVDVIFFVGFQEMPLRQACVGKKNYPTGNVLQLLKSFLYYFEWKLLWQQS